MQEAGIEEEEIAMPIEKKAVSVDNLLSVADAIVRKIPKGETDIPTVTITKDMCTFKKDDGSLGWWESYFTHDESDDSINGCLTVPIDFDKYLPKTAPFYYIDSKEVQEHYGRFWDRPVLITQKIEMGELIALYYTPTHLIVTGNIKSMHSEIDNIPHLEEKIITVDTSNLANKIIKRSNEDVKTGDIIYYNKSTQEFEGVTYDNIDATKYPIESYIPIGVVVIPASHDVYGTGEIGVMSLRSPFNESPDMGSDKNAVVCWGSLGTDVSRLTNYDKAITEDGILDSSPCLPKDGVYRFTPHVPSPYNTDDSRNALYYSTRANTINDKNALSDFNGKENTKILTELATAQLDWKTAEKITNSSESGYYPAACCCWRYTTVGTKQGDWYLPACGELGYIIPKCSIINNSLSKVAAVYGSSYAVTLREDSLLSSSEANSTQVMTVSTSNGLVSKDPKLSSCFFRGWLRIPTTIIQDLIDVKEELERKMVTATEDDLEDAITGNWESEKWEDWSYNPLLPISAISMLQQVVSKIDTLIIRDATGLGPIDDLWDHQAALYLAINNKKDGTPYYITFEEGVQAADGSEKFVIPANSVKVIIGIREQSDEGITYYHCI